MNTPGFSNAKTFFSWGCESVAGLFFSTYESAKTVLSETLPLPQPLVHSAASSIAEMASCLVLAPAEVIKQNAQMLQSQGPQQQQQQYGSTSARALRSLGGSGGAGRKLFTGYTALVARNLPFTALQFPAFEYLRASLWERRGGEPRTEDKGLLETGAISGVSAGTGGAAAAWVTTPSDVVKTRMMLSAGDGGGEGGKGGGKGKLGAWDVTKMVWEDRGLRGFFRGALFRSGWTAMGLGLYLGTYDVAKVWLKRRRPEMDEEAGI